MARLIGSGMLLLVLAACASEQPWWAEGGGRRIEATPMEPPGRAGGYYIVRPGDSVYGIARARNVPIRSLIDSNDLRPPYNLAARSAAGHSRRPVSCRPAWRHGL